MRIPEYRPPTRTTGLRLWFTIFRHLLLTRAKSRYLLFGTRRQALL